MKVFIHNMKMTGLYRPAQGSSWLIRTYTEKQLEEISLDVSPSSDNEDYELHFGLLDGCSRAHNYILAIDKFGIEECSNQELEAR